MITRPILFSGPMVRAILDGRKTQTRRVVKSPASNLPQECALSHRAPSDKWYRDHVWSMRRKDHVWEDYTQEQFLARCPYGVPGDRLWVRETVGGDDLAGWAYRADHPDADIKRGDLDDGESSIRRWTPSIHMPRAASRITLEVTGVRVERLQDISETDAISEGVLTVRTDEFERRHWPEWKHEFDAAVAQGTKPPLGASPAKTFRALWQDINGADSWDANPWVWVVEFRRVA